MDVAARSMPRGYEATGQSFMYVAKGLGSCLGLWLGGKAMDTLGPRIMYRVSAVVVLVGSSVFATVLMCCQDSLEPRREIMVPTEDSDETMDVSEMEESQQMESAVELSELGDAMLRAD